MDQNQLIDSIRKILFFDWDPLNASAAVTADDEYDDFNNRLVELLLKKPSTNDIRDFLKKIESEIHSESNFESREKAVGKLKLLADAYEKNEC